MVRHDERAVGRDAHARLCINAMGLELIDFLEEGLGREHHAVADVANRCRVHDSRGNQTQNRLGTIDDKRMTSVVAAIEAHYAVDMLSKPIDDLPLALIAPLGADNDDVFCHVPKLLA